MFANYRLVVPSNYFLFTFPFSDGLGHKTAEKNRLLVVGGVSLNGC
ncbi:Hypothetical protein CpCAP1R_2141 [Corynebacterium pseudotuberculosis]|nr:Hypothetical protein Cp226_2125 [Corynebacterium pseudotuberculosis]QBG78264.1 Hypothetical protein CpCAP1R_2141 [Corynebacterium pseudotuberculosis]